jgi:folate-binding protein YgfZ
VAEGLRTFLLHREAVTVSGPEAVGYLQGQLSQDIAALDVGASAWSWILQPTGKVDALVRVMRTGPESLVVDVDDGWGQAVLTRLLRFKLRTKAEIAPMPVYAPLGAPRELPYRTVGGFAVVSFRGPGAKAAAAEFCGGEAVDLAPLWPQDEEAADTQFGGRAIVTYPEGIGRAAAWEVERIAAGVPVMGAELTDKTIPAETGLVDRTASFTKGCYTGQELVARIDSRGGNVPRHLRGLRSPSPLVVGTELVAGGKVVGSVTSAVVSPTLGPLGLAYVGRAVSPGATVGAGAEGEPDVQVVELPVRP